MKKRKRATADEHLKLVDDTLMFVARRNKQSAAATIVNLKDSELGVQNTNTAYRGSQRRFIEYINDHETLAPLAKGGPYTPNMERYATAENAKAYVTYLGSKPLANKKDYQKSGQAHDGLKNKSINSNMSGVGDLYDRENAANGLEDVSTQLPDYRTQQSYTKLTAYLAKANKKKHVLNRQNFAVGDNGEAITQSQHDSVLEYLWGNLQTGESTEEFRKSVALLLDWTIGLGTGARGDNRTAFKLGQLWASTFEWRNKLGKGGGRRSEKIPALYFSKDQTKNEGSYEKGHKNMAFPNFEPDVDVILVLCLYLCVQCGFGNRRFDFERDDVIHEFLLTHPESHENIHGNGQQELAKWYKWVFKELGLEERCAMMDVCTHLTRKLVAVLQESMDTKPYAAAESMGWTYNQQTATGKEARNPSAVHYGLDANPNVAKQLSGFKHDEPWANVDYDVLGGVAFEQKELINSVANFMIGHAGEGVIDWHALLDRTEIDKMGRHSEGMTLANSKHLIAALAWHLIVRAPSLRKARPNLFLFQMAGSPFHFSNRESSGSVESPKGFCEKYFEEAYTLLSAYESAADDTIVQNAGPWAAGVSAKMDTIEGKLNKLTTQERADEQAEHLAESVTAKVTANLGSLLVSLLSAVSGGKLPASPSKQKQALETILQEAVTGGGAAAAAAAATPAAASSGASSSTTADSAPPAAAAAAAAGPALGGSIFRAAALDPAACKSIQTTVEKMRKKKDGGGVESYTPPRYFYTPFPGHLKEWRYFNTYKDLFDYWTRATPSRPSYEALEAEGIGWRRNCEASVMNWVSRVKWFMDLLEAVRTRSQSTHFRGESLSSDRVEICRMLDEGRAAKQHPPSLGPTFLQHLLWLQKLEEPFPGHGTAPTAYAALEVQRVQQKRKLELEQTKKLQSAANAERKRKREEARAERKKAKGEEQAAAH